MLGLGLKRGMILKNVIFFPLLWPFKDGHKRKPTALLNWVQYLSEPSLKIQFPFTSEREKTKPAPTFFKYLANQISCLAAMIPLTRLPPLSLLSALADKPSNNCLNKASTHQKIHHPYLNYCSAETEVGGKKNAQTFTHLPKQEQEK